MNGATLVLWLGVMLGMVQAVSMIDYAPGHDVGPEFGSWYEE
jgi:hypothetical protein